MANLIKKIEGHIEEHGQLTISDTDEDIFISPDRFRAGDIITFIYNNLDYTVILISTERTGRGSTYFISTKGNKLVTCIKLDLYLLSHNIFVKKLLEKNKLDYKKIKNKNKGFLDWLLKWFSFTRKSNKERLLNSFMGAKNFRTFIFHKMQTIKRVKLDPLYESNDLDLEDEELE